MNRAVLPPNSLVVFLDETGHEDLASGHSIYGLGGCAVIATELEQCVRAPWRAVRKELNGDPELPLHAADISKTTPREKQELIGNFFRNNSFLRVAVAITTRTKVWGELRHVEYMAPSLMQRIANVLNWTNASSLTLIFESNERADPIINRCFGPLTLGENGANFPIERYFMPKSANDPALEVADFIMHAVHGMAHDVISGKNGYDRRDFKSIFHSVPRKMTDFFLVENVRFDKPMMIASGISQAK